MVEQAYEIIIREITPFLQSQNMKKQDGEEYLFANDKKAVKIWYDTDKSVFELGVADLSEGKGVSFTTYSTFLFDSNHSEKDAKAIGGDFLETLNGVFGIQKTSLVKNQVAIPRKSSGNTTPNVDAFCGKFLSLFPQYKNKYKEDVAAYGGFMYENFFSSTAAVKLNELAQDASAKKNYKKMLSFLDEYFVDGDFTVQSVITYSIVGEACVANPELFSQLEQDMKENAPHLLPSARNMIAYRKKKG